MQVAVAIAHHAVAVGGPHDPRRGDVVDAKNVRTQGSGNPVAQQLQMWPGVLRHKGNNIHAGRRKAVQRRLRASLVDAGDATPEPVLTVE